MYFPQSYLLDVCLPNRSTDGDDYAYEQFVGAEDCLRFLADKYNIHARTVETANAIIASIVDSDATGEAFGSIHTYNADD